MTALERAARNVLAAAWRWNVAQDQDTRTRRLAEDWLQRAVEAHGAMVQRYIDRRLAAARRKKKP